MEKAKKWTQEHAVQKNMVSLSGFPLFVWSLLRIMLCWLIVILFTCLICSRIFYPLGGAVLHYNCVLNFTGNKK